MKKITALLISVLLLSLIIVMPAFADSAATLSNDYQELYMDGYTYSRFDASAVSNPQSYSTEEKVVELTEAQKQEVSDVILNIYEKQVLVYADIYFKDGSSMYIPFLREDCIEEYNGMIGDEWENCIIDFVWPEGNTVPASKSALFSKNKVTLDEIFLQMCDYCDVNIESSDGSFAVSKGAIVFYSDEYYYVDYASLEINITEDFFPYDYTELPAYEITDSELLADIKAAESEYYSDGLGFLYNDDLTSSVSAVFLVFIFGLLPLAVFILFLILAIRAKGAYKKLFYGIAILSALEIILFVTVAIIIAVL